MKPEKGLSYVCLNTYNQYTKGEVYNCNQDGYLEVNGLNYRIQDEVFFESYFKFNRPVLLSEIRSNHKYWGKYINKEQFHIPKDILGRKFNVPNTAINPILTFSKNLTKDKIVLQVVNDLNDRSRIGVEKYGVTLERNDLSLKDWLQHAYEECLDQANYLKRAILEIENKQG